jgi:hypothetical protein
MIGICRTEHSFVEQSWFCVIFILFFLLEITFQFLYSNRLIKLIPHIFILFLPCFLYLFYQFFVFNFAPVEMNKKAVPKYSMRYLISQQSGPKSPCSGTKILNLVPHLVPHWIFWYRAVWIWYRHFHWGD